MNGADGVILEDAQKGQCAMHSEVVRRLDERWRDHMVTHNGNAEEMRTKFASLFLATERVNQKINWILGGMAVIGPIMLIFIQLLITHLQGK